jgi:hypothetical protein
MTPSPSSVCAANGQSPVKDSKDKSFVGAYGNERQELLKLVVHVKCFAKKKEILGVEAD